MTRVVHLINSLDMGGAERMLSRLVIASQRPGLEHYVISLRDAGVFGAEIKAAGASVRELRLKPSPTALLALPRLTELLRSIGPDVLMTWLYHADFLGTLAGRWAKVPRIYWNLRCSDMDFSRYSRSTGLLVRVLAKMSGKPDGIVVNSRAGRAVHEALGYRPRTWLELPNGFDIAALTPDPGGRGALRAELGIPDQAPIIGNIARLDPMKDHDTLLTAFAEVARTRDDVHFVLVGDRITAQAPAVARALTLPEMSGRLHALGLRRDATALLAGFDLYIQSSAFGEGFPNVIGEAMALGVACVVTDVGDAARIVGDTGTAVSPGGAHELAAAIISQLQRPEDERAALAASARRRICDHYDINSVVARYEGLFGS
jgi:glycosyltransferase involved in cell wall biosynthesis